MKKEESAEQSAASAPEGVPVVPKDVEEPVAPSYRHLEQERNSGPTLAEQNVTETTVKDS